MAYDFTNAKKKFSGSKEWLQHEFQNIRTGRATPTLLDGVQVEAYGSRMPLKQVANVGVEDSRTLRIAPFDRALTKDIERAITAANLGVGTSVADTTVRVLFPELTGERRAELIKFAKGKLEEARIAVRGIRNEISDAIEAAEKEGGMGEDDVFRAKEELQKLVDATNRELEELFDKKQEEMNA